MGPRVAVCPHGVTHREQGLPELLHKVLRRKDSEGRSVDECALQKSQDAGSDFLPDPGIEPTSLMFPAFAGGFLNICAPKKLKMAY